MSHEAVLDALWLASGDWTLDLPGSPPTSALPSPYRPGNDRQSAEDEIEQVESGVDPAAGNQSAEAFDEIDGAERGDARDDDPGSKTYAPIQPEPGQATVAASPISLPAARTLADRLPLTRALRPLRQSFASQRASELDEEATAELTAELRSAGLTGVFPVERQARERWFDVHIVLEDDPAAALWEAPLEEFARVLAQSGAFRLVRTWRLELDPLAPTDSSRAALAPLRRSAEDKPNRQDRRVQSRISGGPRELIFFASHGASAHWLDGSYARLLLGWSGAACALLHLLPGDRQAQTALGEPHGVGLAPQAGAPAAAMRAEVVWWRTDADPDSPRSVRLAMATLEPGALGTWALAEMARGRRAPLYLLDADDAVAIPSARPDSLAPHDVEQRLASIRERSAAAYELAIALAVGPFTLPVARVVQEVLFGTATDTTLLADLLLSGIVAMDPYEGFGDATFRVVDHARRTLTEASRAEDRARLVEELQQRVGRQLGEKAAEALSFTALMRDAQGHERLSASIEPFAIFLRPIVTGLAPAPEPQFDVEQFLESIAPGRIGELYRLLIRDEVLSERSVRGDLWRWLRAQRLVTFDDDRWSLRTELSTALQPATRGDPLYGLQILWVDDRPVNNRRVAQSLRSREVSIVETKSTNETMSRSDLDLYDVIISDMSRPPDRDAGFTLIVALQDRGYQTPVIIYASVFARSAENKSRVNQVGGVGCTNDAQELLALIQDAAFLRLRRAALKSSRSARSLDDVRTDLLSLIKYRATTPGPTAEQQVEEESETSRVDPRSRGRPPRQQQQPRQQEQTQQARSQGYEPFARQAPVHLLVDSGITLDTRGDVESQLQLLIPATDAAVTVPQQGSSAFDTEPGFSPRSWHDALGDTAKKIGWTVEQTVTGHGLVEEIALQSPFRQMLRNVVGDGRTTEIVLRFINDWQQSGALAGAEVPDWTSSTADYALRGLIVRLAVLLPGKEEQDMVRLLIFSRFITKIQARNVFLLRFSTKMEADTLMLSLTSSVRNLATLAPSVDARLAQTRASLLPGIRAEDLRG